MCKKAKPPRLFPNNHYFRLLSGLVSLAIPGVVLVSVLALPPVPNPAPTPPVPAAPELDVMFFVVSVDSV